METEEVMAAIRQALRGGGSLSDDELFHAVGDQFGYQRIGGSTLEILKGHLKAAIRREIAYRDADDNIGLCTLTLDQYTRDDLIMAIKSVTRKGTNYEREELTRLVANHLGFVRLQDSVVAPIKSAINGAIRRGILDYEDDLIWRDE